MSFGTMGTHFGAGGGGAASTVSLPAQLSVPSAEDEYAQGFSQVQADTKPEILYLFDETGSPATTANAGRLAGGDGVLTGIDFTGSTLSGFGNAAVFDAADDAIAVGGSNAPFKLSANDGRGDFEMVFRFRFDAVDKLYTLVSTDTTTGGSASASTNGFYSVMVNTASASTVVLEYTLGGVLNALTWSAGTLAIDTDYHLVLAFKADSDTFAGDATGVGKLRCFLDGVALADAAIPANKLIVIAAGATSAIVDMGVNTAPNPDENWPLSLGKYLDGTTSVGAGDALYQLDSSVTDSVRGVSGQATIAGTPNSGSQYQASSIDSAFGNELRLSNSGSSGSNPHRLIAPDVGLGTGDFTIEFFLNPVSGGDTFPLLFCSDVTNPTYTKTTAFELYGVTVGYYPNTYLRSYDANGSYETVSFGGNLTGYSGTMYHWALVRKVDTPSGGLSTWTLFRNGVVSAGSTTTTTRDFQHEIGFGCSYSSNSYLKCFTEAYFDSIRVTKSALYSAGSPPAPPTAPFVAPYSSSDRTFAGKMDEFAVYNSRCIHDTSETFEKPAAPIRTDALPMVSGMDSEGNYGKVITSGNAGEVVPNHREGLSAGSLYSTDGVVKIVQ